MVYLLRSVSVAALVACASGVAAEKYSWRQARPVLDTFCAPCHSGAKAVAGFDLSRFPTEASLLTDTGKWNRVAARLRENTMPPKGRPAPPDAHRQQLADWVSGTLRSFACSDGIYPMRAPVRRLNRAEYGATIRDLLGIHINAGHALPVDGAGGEGFDNAAETLFISPIHAEKYLEAARIATGYAMKDPRSRKVFLPSTGQDSPRAIFSAFLPRAFRRPVVDAEIDRYLALFDQMQRRGANFDESIQFALQGVLISPHFLFRLELPNTDADPQPANDYAMASRLSYFLWGSMPDTTLFELAGQGKLQEPAVLREQVARMLKDAKSTEFAERFVEQWLGTRELGRGIQPDKKLFPEFWDEEIQSGIRYEPILFFRELLAENLPLTNLIDSRFTVASNKLAKLYGLSTKGLRQQPVRVELPDGSHRGGLLGMSAVLASSSMPTRTSPVLRGKWVLDAMLGTPPPPPPPDVPELKENAAGETPKTVRARLEIHRQNPVCAACHNRMDPIGFGLENYDVLGRWRDQDAGQPVDAKGELPDGSKFNGPAELKKLLVQQQDLLAKNVTSKMLGYALGRSLSLEDHCAGDRILEQLRAKGYGARTLVEEIVLSVPFRYQPGTKASSQVTNR